jgi:hypothetical protein
MRSKLFIIVAAMLVFGIGFAVYAYNSTSTLAETVAASCCCCSGDSCPMKTAEAKAATKTEGSHSCCCMGDGASCPMKAKGEKAANGEHSCPMMSEAKHEGHKMATGAKHEMKPDGEGHSCPMMKDGKMAGKHDGMKHAADTKAGHSCGCACCAGEKAKKDPAV